MGRHPASHRCPKPLRGNVVTKTNISTYQPDHGNRYGITHNGQTYSYQGYVRPGSPWQTAIAEITVVEDHDDGPLYWRTVTEYIGDWEDVGKKFDHSHPRSLPKSIREEFRRRGWNTVRSAARIPMIKSLVGNDIAYRYALAPPRCPMSVESTLTWHRASVDEKYLWRRVQARVDFPLTPVRFEMARQAAGRRLNDAGSVAANARKQYNGARR